MLLALAAGVLASGLCALGRSLTPFPLPKDGSTLVTTGIYRFVRHPLYLSVILAAAAVALLKMTPLAWALAAGLAAVLNAKASREERWLAERFPAYDEYRRRTRKLIPFLF